jgi:HSP20 family protein
MGPPSSDRDDLVMLALLRQAALGRAFTPPTDVWSTDAKVVVSVEVPGIDEAALAVDASPAQLTVRGRRHFGGAAEGLDYYHLERSYGEFQCQVALPPGTDPERRTVKLADGVLTVEIPREK